MTSLQPHRRLDVEQRQVLGAALAQQYRSDRSIAQLVARGSTSSGRVCLLVLKR